MKFQGEFVWHSHEAEDEMFLVLQGAFDMQFRDRTVRIGEGEFLVVPRGVEHCPKAEAEVSLMLFEPAGTVNTGTAGGDLTVPEPERIWAPPRGHRRADLVFHPYLRMKLCCSAS